MYARRPTVVPANTHVLMVQMYLEKPFKFQLGTIFPKSREPVVSLSK